MDEMLLVVPLTLVGSYLVHGKVSLRRLSHLRLIAASGGKKKEFRRDALLKDHHDGRTFIEQLLTGCCMNVHGAC